MRCGRWRSATPHAGTLVLNEEKHMGDHPDPLNTISADEIDAGLLLHILAMLALARRSA